MKISLVSVADEVIDFGLLLTFIMEGNANLQIAFTENKDEDFFSSSFSFIDPLNPKDLWSLEL